MRWWKRQTPPIRWTIIGAVVGVILFGFGGVGLATGGLAIGVPAIIVAAAFGSLGGTVEQAYKDGKRFIRKKQKKARENDR